MYDPRISALAQQDPELAAIERRRMLAAMLMQQGQQNQKLTHPLQVVGNLANTALAAFMTRKADDEGKALADQQRSEVRSFFQPGTAPGATPQMPDAAPAGPMTAPPSGPVQRENLPPLAGSTLSVPDYLRSIIQQASDQSGVPFNILAAKLQQESNFRPDARGTSGEVGISQIMPSTGAKPGYGLPPISMQDAADPAKAVPWGAQYLAARAKALGVNDWNDPAQAAKGLAAYNGSGPAADGYGRQVARLAGVGGASQGAQSPQIAANSPPNAPAQGGAADTPIPGMPGFTLGTLTTRVMEGLGSENPRIRAQAEKYVPLLTHLRQQQELNLKDQRANLGQIPQGMRYNPQTQQFEEVGGARPTSTGFQPVTGYDKDGVFVVMFPDGRGGLTQARMPEGVSVAPKTREINTGTEMLTVDQGGNVVARRPIDIAGRERQGVVGKKEGTEIAGAESAYSIATQTLQNIDGVLKHPSIGMGTGMTSALNAIPGTSGYDFSLRVDQLKGQAFLQAFNTLKGAGAISEIEGTKATAAIARLNTRLSTADFKAAVQELRDIVAQAQERAKAKMPEPPAVAGAGPSTAPSSVPIPGSGASAKPPAAPSRPVAVRTPEEARRLPSGTQIELPDGTLGRVP
jgi:soluble lytic murein transglycosylase-like protein